MTTRFSSSTHQDSANKKSPAQQKVFFWSRKKLSAVFFSLVLLGAASQALAVGISLSLPGIPQDANPAEMVNGLYLYALSIGGLLAFGMIVYGGVRYTLSAGNPGLQSDAKDTIYQALLGLLLLLAAYLILSVINPGLTTLILPSLEPLPETTPAGGTGGTPPTCGMGGSGACPYLQTCVQVEGIFRCVLDPNRQENRGQPGGKCLNGNICATRNLICDVTTQICKPKQGQLVCMATCDEYWTNTCSNMRRFCHQTPLNGVCTPECYGSQSGPLDGCESQSCTNNDIEACKQDHGKLCRVVPGEGGGCTRHECY